VNTKVGRLLFAPTALITGICYVIYDNGLLAGQPVILVWTFMTIIVWLWLLDGYLR